MPLIARVLFVLENDEYPRDSRVRREAEALRDAGLDISVIAPRGKGQLWRERLEGIEVFRFPSPRGGKGILGYALEFAYSTAAILALTLWVAIRRGVDIIHAANPPDTLFAIGALLRPFGTRFVFDQHDLAPETYLSRFARLREGMVHKVLLLLERCSFAVASVVISPNDSYRRVAIERGRKDPKEVFVVRNGPPLSYVPLGPSEGLVKRSEYLIGYVGTIGPQDGVDYWMRAVRELVYTLRREDFIAIVIGDGDAFEGVKALAKEFRIERHVIFTGRLSEVDARRYLSATAVCVQPDPLSPLNDQSSMIKLMEYMALGKPTVAFDLFETRWCAQGAAVYTTPNDVLEFAKNVAWLLDHPDQRRKMGNVGRARVQQQLAWEYSVGELLKAYREGLGVRMGRSLPIACEPLDH